MILQSTSCCSRSGRTSRTVASGQSGKEFRRGQTFPTPSPGFLSHRLTPKTGPGPTSTSITSWSASSTQRWANTVLNYESEGYGAYYGVLWRPDTTAKSSVRSARDDTCWIYYHSKGSSDALCNFARSCAAVTCLVLQTRLCAVTCRASLLVSCRGSNLCCAGEEKFSFPPTPPSGVLWRPDTTAKSSVRSARDDACWIYYHSKGSSDALCNFARSCAAVTCHVLLAWGFMVRG